MRATAFSPSWLMPATPKYISRIENQSPAFVGINGGTRNEAPAGVGLLSFSIVRFADTTVHTATGLSLSPLTLKKDHVGVTS